MVQNIQYSADFRMELEFHIPTKVLCLKANARLSPAEPLSSHCSQGNCCFDAHGTPKTIQGSGHLMPFTQADALTSMGLENPQSNPP